MLTIKQAAERLGLNPETVRAMAKSGALPCYRVGPRHGRIRINAEDCDRYLRACRVEPKPEARPATVKRPATAKYQYQVISPSPRPPRARRHAR